VNVDDAYAETLAITAREARNFAWGIRVLPGPKRRAVAALYAFARRVDDVADEPGVAADVRSARLQEIGASLDGRPGDDPVLVALADARGRYPIPDAALRDLVRGGLMDTERTRYRTWDELREYCRCVAGAVGIACAAVYGPREPARAAPLAETLGLALQQINIMRDVPEDRLLGRIYLPEDERARFGVSEDEIATGRPGPGWVPLLEHQAARAEALLEQGLELLHLLDRRSRLCVRSFAGIYHGLLVQMGARDYDVFSRRPGLSAVAKVRAVARLPMPPEARP
jgi:phytoene synthase